MEVVMYNKSINSFRIAEGVGLVTCDWCKVLRKYGVNSTRAMRGLGVYPKYWRKKLWAHEEYHLQRGEQIPVECSEAGLSDEFIANVLTPQPRRVYRAPVQRPSMEQDAVNEFIAFARPVIHQKNGRTENRPIIKPLDLTPFKGAGRR